MKPMPLAGTSAMRAGPINFVIDAPTLPAPNTPSAKPWRWRSAQAAFQAIPIEKELPAMPNKNAHTSNWVKVVARATISVGTAVISTSSVSRRRPPTRSVRMPRGRRQIEPLRMAIAPSQENCTVSRCSSLRMGTPSTPNISQTANSSVKAIVESVRTRVEGFIAS
jgi:hypothetical protein